MTDTDYLQRARELAAQSPEQEDIGCGVVLVRDGAVLAEAYNSQHADNMAVYHAEIKAIMAANRATGSRKLERATAYCSCEPCAMCLTALSYAKVPRIVFELRMKDLFPGDPQSQFDSFAYVQTLNFVPKLEHLSAVNP